MLLNVVFSSFSSFDAYLSKRQYFKHKHGAFENTLATFDIRNQYLVYVKLTARPCSLYGLQRISLKEIKSHPWFLKNLPRELTESAQAVYYQRGNPSFSIQSVEEIMKIVGEARDPPPVSRPVKGFGWDGEEDEGEEDVEEEEDEEDEYDKRVKEVHASGEFQIS